MSEKPKVYVRKKSSSSAPHAEKASPLYVYEGKQSSSQDADYGTSHSTSTSATQEKTKRKKYVSPTIDYSPDAYHQSGTTNSTSRGGKRQKNSSKSSSRKGSGRIRFIDALRGAAIVSMILFHLAYDLKFIYEQRLDWFAPPLQDIWRSSISWTFLALAGITSTLSRNNFYRAERYLACALGVFSVTSLFQFDRPITFGIIFCMGATTLLYALLEKLQLQPRGVFAALVLWALFIASLNVSQKTFGIGPYTWTIPNSWYENNYLSWLGFPGPNFSSGDYYPLIPYSFAYLTFAALADSKPGKAFLSAVRNIGFKPLEVVGKHPLILYMAHQPVMLAILNYLFS